MDSVRSGHVIGISTTICSFVDAPRNFNTSLFLHLKKILQAVDFLKLISCFRNSHPGMGRALLGIKLIMGLS
jgi:hypothetical protein